MAIVFVHLEVKASVAFIPLPAPGHVVMASNPGDMGADATPTSAPPPIADAESKWVHVYNCQKLTVPFIMELRGDGMISVNNGPPHGHWTYNYDVVRDSSNWVLVWNYAGVDAKAKRHVFASMAIKNHAEVWVHSATDPAWNAILVRADPWLWD